MIFTKLSLFHSKSSDPNKNSFLKNIFEQISDLFSKIKLYKFGIFISGFNKLFYKIGRYEKILIYSLNLKNENINKVEPKLSNLKIEKHDTTKNIDFLKSRNIKFHKNRTCYCVVYKGKLIGYGWIAKDSFDIKEINYTYKLKKDEIIKMILSLKV